MSAKIVILLIIIVAGLIFFFFSVFVAGSGEKPENNGIAEANLSSVYISAFDNKTGEQVVSSYLVKNSSGRIQDGNMREDSSTIIRNINRWDDIEIFVLDDNNDNNDYYMEREKIKIRRNETVKKFYLVREGFMKFKEKNYINNPWTNTTTAVFELENSEPDGAIRYPLICAGWKHAISVTMNLSTFGKNPIPKKLSTRADACWSRRSFYYLYEKENIELEIRRENLKDDVELEIWIMDKAFSIAGSHTAEGYSNIEGKSDPGIPDFYGSYIIP